MIQAEGIHHEGVVVTDLERAKTFYGEILGLKEIPRPNFQFPGAWFAIGDQQIHLLVHPEGQTLRKQGGIDTRDGHLAIRVSSYTQAKQWLQERDIAFVDRPDSIAGFAQIYIVDPDDNVIELNAPYAS